MRSEISVRRTVSVLFVYFSIELLLVPTATAEFYKYQDKSGKIHYVDDIGKIPPAYREDLKVYKGTQDHLSDEEKENLQYQQQKQEEYRRQDLMDQLRERKATEKKRKEDIKRQQFLKTLVTKVTIKGNQVLVPVTIAFGPKETTALLVLDTGAEIVVLHKDFADRMNIRSFRTAKATVADGKTVQVGMAKLTALQVGPHKKTNVLAAVMNPVSKLHFNGLLGMNFLRGLEYRVDFDNKVTVWKP